MAKLESVLNSDDRLELDESFHVDIIISKMPFTRPKGDKYPICLTSNVKFASILAREICSILKKGRQKNHHFYMLCKRGYLDIHSLVKHANCAIICLAFGIMLKRQNYDLNFALENFLKRHRFLSNIFLREQFYPLNVDDLVILDFWQLLDVLSREFNIKFVVYSGEHIFDATQVFSTGQSNMGPPIYLFLKSTHTETHTYLIFDLSALSKKRNFGVTFAADILHQRNL